MGRVVKLCTYNIGNMYIIRKNNLRSEMQLVDLGKTIKLIEFGNLNENESSVFAEK